MSRHVVMVMNSLRSGGAEKQLLWIVTDLQRRGMKCSVFELQSGERTERIEMMVRHAIDCGVEVVRAPSRSSHLSNLFRLRMHIAKLQPSVVWSWGLRADMTCLLIRRIIRRKGRWLISVRSAAVGLKRSVFVAQLVAGQFCDGIISNTRVGLQTGGFAHASAVPKWVLPNAVSELSRPPVSLPEHPPKPLILMMLGNIKIDVKGYDVAASVVRLLRQKDVAFELRIAGRPDELDELEEIFLGLGVRPQMKFYGEVSRPEQFLREGHLFLLLSRFEGMPNTLLEALQIGLPAIATEVGDLRALKDRGAPFHLIPVADADAVAEAVQYLLAHWPETRAIAAQGPTWIQNNFSERACRVMLQEILNDVVNV